MQSSSLKARATTSPAFTLIELLVVLAIVALMTGLAVPSGYRILESNKAANGINWIAHAIHLTRRSAVNYGTMTTLCPAEEEGICGGTWHDRVMVFTDQNADRQVNGTDQILTYLNFPYQGATLNWRSFGNRQYLQMTPAGFTNFQNGNFVYCSAKQEPQFARQIVLNLQGRVKKARDQDGDGLWEDRLGKPLRC